MPLTEIKKEIEAEKLVGYHYLQYLGRAEALVPGAGRDAVEPLLNDAGAAIIRCDVQGDRVVLDGAIQCQGVYRLGQEMTLRAIGAKANFSQVAEISGAQPGMIVRSEAQVENVESHYENGHMVFHVSVGISIWVISLEKTEAISQIEDGENIECQYQTLRFEKLAAEAGETAVMTANVELPHSLDARTTLMDWGSVLIDSTSPDLGGVRVKGRAMIETLVASGIEGRPAAVVKYPISFDKLIEIPEWLSENASVRAQLRNIRTQIDAAAEGEEGRLLIQADVYFTLTANVREEIKLLSDAYGTGTEKIDAEYTRIHACSEVVHTQTHEIIRGTVLTDEGAPAVGSIIAVRARANLADALPEGDSTRLSGIIEADVLFMPSGSDFPAAARTELPFEMSVPQLLNDTSMLRLSVCSAEANALMSDRLEMKIGINAECETRRESVYQIVRSITSEECAPRRSAYVIIWPEKNEDGWSIAKRYSLPQDKVLQAAGEGGVQAGKCIILNL